MSVSVPRRFGWIDQARGIGIVLVVIGHCLRGLVHAGILPADAVTAAIDQAIYSFHIPLFFFLSGLTFAASAGRQGGAAFLSGRVMRLLWPLVLWTWIFFALQELAKGSINSVPGPFPWFPLPPRLHFWFLWALLLIQLTIFPAIRGGIFRLFAAIAIVAIGFSALQFSPPLSVWIEPALDNLIFFLAGMVVDRSGCIPRLTAMQPVMRAGRILFGGGIFLLAVGWAAFDPVPVGMGTFLAMAAIAGLVLVVAQDVLPRALSDFLQFCGRLSMAIFLTHTIFSAGIRIGLVSMHITAWPAHLLLGVLAGMIGPMVLSDVARRLGMVRLLGF